jgi:hypothetical protein
MDTHDVDVDKWCKTSADYATLAPDGIQWIGNTYLNFHSATK